MTEKKRRGFSAMDESTKREIARKGGIAAHRKGTAHKFTSEEAREAGRKGGRSAHRQGRAHKFTPEEAKAAGRKGGLASPSQMDRRLPGAFDYSRRESTPLRQRDENCDRLCDWLNRSKRPNRARAALDRGA